VNIYSTRRVYIQRAHEHARTGNWSESGFGSLGGAPLDTSRCVGGNPVYDRNTYIFKVDVFTDGLYITSTRARTHRELVREWLWESERSALGYI